LHVCLMLFTPKATILRALCDLRGSNHKTRGN
jgi:hypothetical protein